MSDIKNPVSKDPYSKVNSPTPIAPIEKDKKDKNKFDEANNSFENEENAKSFIYGTLLSFINEILKNTPKQPQISNNALNNTLKITCQKLIELFSNLIKQDHSHDPKFYHELSLTWQQLSKISYEMNQFDIKAHETQKMLDMFISNLLTYPQSEEFSLGYYLSEGSDETWTPFPLMKILQKLHVQSQKEHRSSPLHEWIDRLHQVTNTLGNDST